MHVRQPHTQHAPVLAGKFEAAELRHQHSGVYTGSLCCPNHGHQLVTIVNQNLQLYKSLQLRAAVYLTAVMCTCRSACCKALLTKKVALPEDLLCSWSVGSSGSSCLSLAAPLDSFRARGPEQKPLWPENLVQQGLREQRPGAAAHHQSHLWHGHTSHSSLTRLEHGLKTKEKKKQRTKGTGDDGQKTQSLFVVMQQGLQERL